MRTIGLRSVIVAAALLAATPSLAETPVTAGPCSTLKPIQSTHIMPSYPQISATRGEFGRTVLIVTIGPDGAPSDVSVQTSSGSPDLDAAAVDGIKKRWRWTLDPACTTGVRRKIEVSFNRRADEDKTVIMPPLSIAAAPTDFPPGAADRHESGVVSVLVVFDDKGAQRGGLIMNGSGFRDLDECAVALVNARHLEPPKKDGKVSAGMMAVIVKFDAAH
jgi:TonB family protein